MRIGYFGPEGTFTHEALLAAGPEGADQARGYPTIPDTILGVAEGEVDLALAPIENSLEGSVNATLDALALETDEVAIVGEVVHPIRMCLIAGHELSVADVEQVVSHPQPSGQCARFLRRELPRARVRSAASTAEAVREVIAAGGRPWAALGNRLAAELYGGVVLREGVEDEPGNETRFVWLGRRVDRAGAGGARHKTAVVFWGAGSESPGWLVRCLAEFAERGVNLTRIESRPRKQGLGRYMFFVDLEGGDHDPPVAEALAGLRRHVEELRVLGSYPLG